MKRSLEEQEAEHAAEQLVAERKLVSLPICPFTIAEGSGIMVAAKASTDPGVSGFLMLVGNSFGIGYAKHIKNDGFIRFSVAHELGHYFLPGHPDALFPTGDGVHQSHSGYVSDNALERQADVFATTLLMPEQLFLPALRQAGEGFKAIENLAAACRTSITATAIRFARYAEDPVAVVLSSGGTVNWCFRSKALEEVRGLRHLRKGTPVPQGTATALFNKDSNNVVSGNRAGDWTSLDDWFDDAPQVEMQEEVIGLGTYGRTLTILFTNEAIDDGEDDHDDD